MASARQLTAASKVVGEQVYDLVPVQFRKKAFPAVLALGLVVAFVIFYFAPIDGGGSGILFGALTGAVVGAVFTLGTSPRALAISPRGLSLLGSSIWIPTPREMLGSVAPQDVALEGGFINRIVRIAGDKHVVSRVHVARLEQMLAAAARGPGGFPE